MSNAAIVSVLGDSQTVTTHVLHVRQRATRSRSWPQPIMTIDAMSCRSRSTTAVSEGRPQSHDLNADDVDAAMRRRPPPRLPTKRRTRNAGFADYRRCRRRRKVTTRDPFGRETGTDEWEEDAASRLAAHHGRRRRQTPQAAAYDAMVRETCDAWRDPSPLPVATDAAPPPHRDAAPLPPTFDVAEGRRRKREAYDHMCREDADAWKDPSR